MICTVLAAISSYYWSNSKVQAKIHEAELNMAKLEAENQRLNDRIKEIDDKRVEIEQEIAGSVDYLSKLEGLDVNTQIFAYPFGRKQDMNNSSYEVLRQAGVKFGLAGEGGSIKSRPDKFFMPRIGIEQWNIWCLSLAMIRL